MSRTVDQDADPATRPAGTLDAQSAADEPRGPADPSMARRLLAALSPKRLSLVYIVGVFMVIFAFWVPDLFYTATTYKALLYQQAVTAVVALAFLIPYTTLNFDLTVGAIVGVSSLTTCWLIVEQHVAVPLAIVLSLAFCSAIGALTGFMVTVLRIDSIIATIAMMFIIDALGSAALDGKQVFGLPSSYTMLSSFEVFGISAPFIYLIVIGLILWYVLVHTPVGRYLYAVGGGKEAARLSGIGVNRIIFGAFVASGLLAGIAGVMVSSRVAGGDFAVGEPYLFPAAAAIFLGATQVRPGVFNVAGTIITVYGLGIIVKGLELGGAPYWLPDLMNGAALLTAVAVSDAKLWRRTPIRIVRRRVAPVNPADKPAGDA